MEYFNRSVALTVETGTEARTFKTRILFEIEKTEESDANPAKISVYNLSKESLAFLRQKNLRLRLNAGYEDKTGILFSGDIAHVQINREKKGDVTVEIEAGDGWNALTGSRIEIRVEPGGNNRQALDQVLKRLGLTRTTFASLPLRIFKKGWVHTGSTKAAIDYLVKDAGFKWSVQNGEIQIQKPGEASAQELIVVRAESGLLDYPTPGTSSESILEGLTQRDYDWSFKTLLDIRLIPGRRVRLISPVTGTANLILSKVSHKGDSEQDEYATTCEARLA